MRPRRRPSRVVLFFAMLLCLGPVALPTSAWARSDSGSSPGHTVTPIDLEHRTVGQPIEVGTGPLAIAITPDGTKAAVTLQKISSRPGHRVAIIDLASALPAHHAPGAAGRVW